MATKQELMQNWVDTLKTTDKQQGKGHLKKNIPQEGTKYCCLGIAAEFSLGKTFQSMYEGSVLVYFYTENEGRREYINVLDDDAGDSLGLLTHLTADEINKLRELNLVISRGDKFSTGDSRMSVLWNLNDTFNYTFKQIAEFIETMDWIEN